MPAYGRMVSFGDDVRAGIRNGVDVLCNAVKVTLGPSGRYVVYRDGMKSPVATKDGVTVAKKVDIDDELGDIGASMVREVALKTLSGSGDGTTTACVLTQAMVSYGFDCVSRGEDPVVVKARLDDLVSRVDSRLVSSGVPVSGRSDIFNVASVSSNGDAEVAGLVADAFKRVGGDGVVMVESGGGFSPTLEYIEGLEYGRGYLSPYFVTEVDRRECRLDRPYVFIYNDKINSINFITPLLSKFVGSEDSLLIVCNDIDLDILGFVVANKQAGKIKVSVLKSPSFGDVSCDLLEDLAVLTGGMVLDRSMFNSLDSVELGGRELGRCKGVVMTDSKTTILGGIGSRDAVSARVSEIRASAAAESDAFKKEFLAHRASSLAGGVCIIKSGGATESEMLERKDRIDDAVCAVRSALAEGVLPGGGVALLRIAWELGDGTGILSSPFRQILKNAGYGVDEVDNMANMILSDAAVETGFDVRSREICNMVERGILDPVKVVRLALKNAASIAGILMMSECVIGDYFENIHDSGTINLKKMLGV